MPFISHETFCAAVHALPSGSLRGELVRTLRKSHAGRWPRARGRSRFTSAQNTTSIGLCPSEVDQRVRPGHWKADLIKGSHNGSAFGTLIERTSCDATLANLDGRDAQSVLEGSTKRLRTVPASLRKTLTHDQGTELALSGTLAKRLKMDIRFCDPHGPRQRAADENAHGLIRVHRPKGTDLSTVTNAELRAIEGRLNTRPRQILRFQTPDEVFSRLTLDEFIGVALRA